MDNVFFLIFIYPIKLGIEIIYMLFDWVFKGNPGISILGVSIAVSLGCLPLYAKAEGLQQKEREMQKKLEKRAKSIKKNFTGDEQYMILSTYYRQNKYHPVYALRSSMSLLIQVPFFIAAYSFLSHLTALQGKSLWIIKDLAQPDGLLSINGIQLNILPILMTLINVVSGIIYTKGFPKKEKIQLYVMSLFFLVLLYKSPSALVVYWTFNNIFSLIKNIFYKLKNPKKIAYALLCIIILCVDYYVFFIRRHSESRKLRNYVLTLAGSIFFVGIPFYLYLIRRAARVFFTPLFESNKEKIKIFVFLALALWLLWGLYIPFSLVASSPSEFSFIGKHEHPFELLYSTFFQTIGLLLFWPIFIYVIFPKKIKAFLIIAFGALFSGAVTNVFFLNVSGGVVTQILQFMDGLVFKTPKYYGLLNIGITCTLFALFCFCIYKRKLKIVVTVLFVFCISMGSLITVYGFKISTGYKNFVQLKERENNNIQDKKVYSLSKNGKNVFIIMLDKAVNAYFELALEEKPELREAYNGFTYYPNTLSYAQKTIIGAPPVFGGYEYTPLAMNERNTERMVDKYNESLLVLPTIFKKNGYSTLTTDIPFINYQWVSDINFFIEKGFGARNILGNYSGKYIEEEKPELSEFSIKGLLDRNFLFYSVLTSVPVPLKKAIYNEGKYWNSSLTSLSTLTLDSYAALYYLNELTEISKEGNTFNCMINNLTHDYMFLEQPEYTWGPNTDPTKDIILGESKYYDVYHVNVASVKLLAQWLNMLRKEGVFDNTRIIIVSDHGTDASYPEKDSFFEHTISPYNPLLLVKDFNEQNPLKKDTTFMTNADVPYLAIKDLFEDDTNPFTKERLSKNDKKDGVVIVESYTIHQGYTPNLMKLTTCFNSGASGYKIKDSIFEKNNWQQLTMP